MSIAAYKRTIREVESPRQIERRVFVRVTGEMDRQSAAFDTAQARAERGDLLAGGLRNHLSDNLKLWTTIKHDLAHPDNGLPAPLKAGLISLALFVERKTAEVIGGETGVGILVQINQSLISGLSGNAPSV